MVEFQPKARYQFDDLLRIMALLRAPGGCPWDREQTHASIRHNFIEEVYEACEAIDREDSALLREELGDVMLQVVFHAQIAQEEGAFTLDDVIDELCRKLVIRHPHVFGDLTLNEGTAGEVLKNWETIKNETKNNKTCTETLDAVAKTLPALMRAEKTVSRARRGGYLLPPETDEPANEEVRIGRALFALAAEAKAADVDPEEALNRETARFVERVRQAEAKAGVRK